MGRKLKVLVAGDTAGQLDVVFAKVAAFNASKAGPFDLLFCVGRFFAPAADGEAAAAAAELLLSPYIEGEKSAPIRTFFLTGAEPTPSCCPDGGAELADNITYLGRGGVANIRGLNVAFLSGAFDSSGGGGGGGGGGGSSFTREHIEAVRRSTEAAGFGGVDVLLTAGWGLGAGGAGEAAGGCPAVGEAAVLTKPRYHFAAGAGVFFERAPYRNGGGGGGGGGGSGGGAAVTRFLGIGAVAPGKLASKDKKWIYGLQLEGGVGGNGSAAEAEPAGTTACPYALPPTAGAAGGGADAELPEAKRRRVGVAAAAAPPPPAPSPSFMPPPPAGMSAAQVAALEAQAASANSFFFKGQKQGGMGGMGGMGGGMGGGGQGGRPSSAAHQRPRDFLPQRGDCAGADEHKLFVGGIAPTADAGLLYAAFGGCGAVLEARVVMDRQRQSSHKGYGFVVFAEAAGAERALASMGGHELHGRALRVSTPNKRADAGAGGGGGGCASGAAMYTKTRDDCWFCLASPHCETHLVSSIGQEAYLCVPKGALEANHQLVVPIEHAPSLAMLAVVNPSCWAEVTRYKEALVAFHRSRGCGAVTTERFTATRGAVHAHFQVVPVPLAELEAARGAFQSAGAKQNVVFEELGPDTTLEQAVGRCVVYAVAAAVEPPVEKERRRALYLAPRLRPRPRPPLLLSWPEFHTRPPSARPLSPGHRPACQRPR
jgi:hypothetical protein